MFNRRQWLSTVAASIAGASASGFLPAFAADLAGDPRRKRHCVLLWMTGGPSQIDTFDPKPGHKNGGEFTPLATGVWGLQIGEHLPQLAKQIDRLAIVRSLSTKEGDHGRGTYLMHTGHQPMGAIQYPAIGSSLARHMGSEADELPSCISISPYRAFNPQAFAPGFLGPKYAPLTVGAADQFNPMPQPMANANDYAKLTVDDLSPPGDVDNARLAARVDLLRTFQGEFLAERPLPSPVAQDTAQQRAIKLMQTDAAKAFDLDQEPAKVRDAYGRGRFGQGCLLARRMIERGVPFIEVGLGTFGNGMLGWDTHGQNFRQVKALCEELDRGWATLMSELADRGLLDATTICWMGEFGRTPIINAQGGRDHYPNAWSAVLAGGGIRGGQAYGRTGPDGMEVTDGKCEIGDLLATLCAALGVPPETQNISEMGRPIRIAEGKVIKELIA